MTRLTRIARSDCAPITADALAALQAVANKYGLTVTRKSGSYSEATFNLSLIFAVQTAGGIPANFVRDAPLVGLQASDYGKTFTTYSGQTYKVTGIALSRYKLPISVEDVKTGKGYKMTAAQVINDLKRAA